MNQQRFLKMNYILITSARKRGEVHARNDSLGDGPTQLPNDGLLWMTALPMGWRRSSKATSDVIRGWSWCAVRNGKTVTLPAKFMPLMPGSSIKALDFEVLEIWMEMFRSRPIIWGF